MRLTSLTANLITAQALGGIFRESLSFSLKDQDQRATRKQVTQSTDSSRPVTTARGYQ
jgi:hypothetical protein